MLGTLFELALAVVVVLMLVMMLWLALFCLVLMGLAVSACIIFFLLFYEMAINHCNYVREQINQFINSLPRAPRGHTDGTAGGTTGGYLTGPDQTEPNSGSSSSEYSWPRYPGVSLYDDCPICLDRLKFATETNCGHVFCGPCILRCWDRATRPVKCPYCRQTVTLLMKCFSEEDLQSPDQDSVSQQVSRYNRTFLEEPRGFITSVRDLPTIMRHVRVYMFSVGGLTLLTMNSMPVYLIACVLYLASPIDVLPEVILGPLGLLDDVYVLIRFVIYVSNIYRRIVAEIEVD